MRGLGHLLHVAVDIAVQDRHQRLDVEHIPVDRQIALFQLPGERAELVEFGIEIGQDEAHHRLRGLMGQHRRHRIQLLKGCARRGGFDGGDDQAVHLAEQPGVGQVTGVAAVDVLQMAKIALALVERTEQSVTLQVASLPALQHAGHALLKLVAALDDPRHQPRLLLRQRRIGKLLQRVTERRLGLFQAVGFVFILQCSHHLRQSHRRRRHVGGFPCQVHAAGHVIQGLTLHLLLNMAGVAKAQHRHAADH